MSQDPDPAIGADAGRTAALGRVREASVLVPVHRGADRALRLVMLKRSEGGIHGGQLAFPGGGPEPEDRTPLDTALREAEEEIGLARSAVTILAELKRVETRVSGYRITPFLGRIVPPPAWRPDPREVASVFELRLDDLARPEARGEAIEHFATWSEPRRIEFFKVGEDRLWGVSYRILAPLLPRLLASEWEI